MVQCQLHFLLMTGAAIFFNCQAQRNGTELFSTVSYPTPNVTSVPGNKDSTTTVQVLDRVTLPVTTKGQRPLTNDVTKDMTTTPKIPLNCETEKYRTGIMICIIIIAVLVLVCAILIICSVVLANKVASLKRKLTTSKRQVRSNGDFLSASSILWPTTDTWQRKAQLANLSMDEISLANTNTTEQEKDQLMGTLKFENLKYSTGGINTTLEKDNKTSANVIVEI
ncbi:protein EVI2A [Pelodytes ibericus]